MGCTSEHHDDNEPESIPEVFKFAVPILIRSLQISNYDPKN